jgi:fatty-acyl-CoA synthase
MPHSSGVVGGLPQRLSVAVRSLGVIRRSGLIRLSRPDLVVRSGRAIRTLGPLAGPARVAAARDRRAIGLVDELGPLTFDQLDRRSNALAQAWAGQDIGEGSVIALLARDHRGAVDTMLAAGKLGATLVPMNTGFAAPQLADVAQREGVTAVVYDEEFAEVVAGLPAHVQRFVAWVDGKPGSAPTLEALIAGADDRPAALPRRPGGLVMLTSGTGGTPKGAPREIKNPLSVAQLIDRIPLRSGECTVIGTPLFHGTGLSQFIMSFALGSTVVIRRRFDPQAALQATEKYRATALILVPTMLQRIVDLDPRTLSSYDVSSLRIILVAGAALSPELGNRATALFGDVIYNMYGATEISVATVAMPEDWRAAPGTVGRPPVGCRVALFDPDDRRITQPNVIGRVFVGSDLTFGGYSDGSRKEIIDGMLACGDLGHFDGDGRLFIDGRADDMIVSGGENVYPIEVENLLVEHPGVADAVVVGVPDQEFGQRLVAYIVPAPGAEPVPDELKAFVGSNLARYKVPRDIVFIDELPRSPTGKLLRDRLGRSGSTGRPSPASTAHSR